MDVVSDPWQDRLHRLRRLLPLPLLALSTAGAVTVAAATGSWARLDVGAPLTLAAATWWLVVGVRYRPSAPAAWWTTVFAVHSALSAVLVWVSTWYGVFAYAGFLYAYLLPRRVRVFGFAVTALITSAALVGGYPGADLGEISAYVLVGAVMLALVLNAATITTRAIEQNQERGRMIEALGEANRRLEATMAENAELHARLMERAREAGVLDERQRLAGEIHDTLAQGLTGIIAQLQAAEQTRHRPEESGRHLAQAGALARSSLTEARRSVRALRPEQLDEASLPEAIGGLARTWSVRSAVPAEVEVTGDVVRAGPDIEAAVFRVAQEALSNVAKHAGASAVRLTLSYVDGALLLDVVDDGVGFDPAAPTTGYGRLSMRERLARVGGTLTVESAPGAGTSVNASTPIPGTDAADQR